jgi:8-oxo-dGTP diphosphatase
MMVFKSCASRFTDGHVNLLPVAAAIIFRESEVLVARRRKGLHLEGLWEFPGGKIEAGESPEQCLERELMEELGIQCRIDSFVGESVYAYSKKTVQLLGYRGVFLHGIFRLVDHDEVRWLEVGDSLLSLNWAPADIPLVRLVVERGASVIS